MLEFEILLKISPSAYFLLNMLERVYVNDSRVSAMVYGRYLVIGERFWEFEFQKRVWVLLHEAYHKFLRHDKRILFFDGDPLDFNKGADAKVNWLIFKDYPQARQWLVDWSKYFGEWEVEHLSAEDLARMVGKFSWGRRLKDWERRTNVFNDFDLNYKWDGKDDVLVELAISLGKLFSRGKGKEERVVQVYEGSKIDWGVLLGEFVSEYYWLDWGRWNRRLGKCGRYVQEELKKVVAVDVSMSISDLEFNRFVSAVQSLDFDKVIFFDNGVQSVNDEVPRRVRGKGGTRFGEVLDVVCDEDDVVLIVFTDGYWDDEEEVSKRLKELEFPKVLITVDKVVDGFDKVIKLDVYDL